MWHVTKSSQGGGELLEASQAVEMARSIAATKIVAQAAACRAEFVVGSDVKLAIKEVPCGFESCALNDLDVDVSWFGTGIRRIPGRAEQVREIPPLLLSMMPLGRRRDLDVAAEDDDEDEVEKAAENAEEAALEADD